MSDQPREGGDRNEEQVITRLMLVKRLPLFFPGLGFRELVSAIVAAATCSPFVHAAIAQDGAVLDPTLDGDRVSPELLWLDARRHQTVILRVNAGPIDLDTGRDAAPRKVLPVVTKWLTLGLCGYRDCVSVCSGRLRSGGVPVPFHIASPRELAEWLIQKGHAHVESPEPV